jgi:CRISPR-associated endonuclease Cas1
MEFATGIIAQKIANSVETLEAVIPAGRCREAAITTLQRQREDLVGAPPKPGKMGDLLGIEGRAAAAYFKAWEGLQLQWKSTIRRPISDGWRAVGPRASVRVGKAKNRHAAHPLNAMLNYAYAVLQGQMQIEAVSAGYDPTHGIMHTSFDGSPALVLDLMEPRRPKVDAAVLAFALGETFNPADFVVRSDGTVRLMPQLARRVCQLVAHRIGPVGKAGEMSPVRTRPASRKDTRAPQRYASSPNLQLNQPRPARARRVPTVSAVVVPLRRVLLIE